MSIDCSTLRSLAKKQDLREFEVAEDIPIRRKPVFFIFSIDEFVADIAFYTQRHVMKTCIK